MNKLPRKETEEEEEEEEEDHSQKFSYLWMCFYWFCQDDKLTIEKEKMNIVFSNRDVVYQLKQAEADKQVHEKKLTRFQTDFEQAFASFKKRLNEEIAQQVFKNNSKGDVRDGLSKGEINQLIKDNPILTKESKIVVQRYNRLHSFQKWYKMIENKVHSLQQTRDMTLNVCDAIEVKESYKRWSDVDNHARSLDLSNFSEDFCSDMLEGAEGSEMSQLNEYIHQLEFTRDHTDMSSSSSKSNLTLENLLFGEEGNSSSSAQGAMMKNRDGIMNPILSGLV